MENLASIIIEEYNLNINSLFDTIETNNFRELLKDKNYQLIRIYNYNDNSLNPEFQGDFMGDSLNDMELNVEKHYFEKIESDVNQFITRDNISLPFSGKFSLSAKDTTPFQNRNSYLILENRKSWCCLYHKHSDEESFALSISKDGLEKRTLNIKRI